MVLVSSGVLCRSIARLIGHHMCKLPRTNAQWEKERSEEGDVGHGFHEAGHGMSPYPLVPSPLSVQPATTDFCSMRSACLKVLCGLASVTASDQSDGLYGNNGIKN